MPAARRDPRSRNDPKPAQVEAVTDLTSTMRRLTLVSPHLVGAVATGPDQRVKIAFPEGRRFGDDPAEMSRARRRRRTYTLLNLDAEAGRADVDFVLHGGGLAGEWAAAAQVGDEVALTLPVGTFEVSPGATELLLLADDTGLPAARAIGAQYGATLPVRAAIEVGDAEQQQRVDGVDVTWLRRGEGRALADLADAAVESGVSPTTHVWIAGETEAVRLLRTRFVADLGVDRGRVDAVAYWQRGRVEGAAAAGRPGEH